MSQNSSIQQAFRKSLDHARGVRAQAWQQWKHSLARRVLRQNSSWKRAMIHHVSLGTSDVERARRFYDPVMELLGLRMLECERNGVHYG
jgi:hypothetical protein